MITPGRKYTIRQLSNTRFMDAYENSNDFSVVTRPLQLNDSQAWQLESDDNSAYTIMQVSTGRFIDAYEAAADDFSVVTRLEQNNDSQKWVIEIRGFWGPLVQSSTLDALDMRFMDAYENAGNDFKAVTRPGQLSSPGQVSSTQIWVFKQLGDLGDDVYSIQQLSNYRFLDAYENSENDFSVVTRPSQQNDSQRWNVTDVDNSPIDPLSIVTIQQVSSSRFVDAYENAANDFAVVTRPAQNNDTQRWELRLPGGFIATIRQASSNRFLDAYESESQDFSLVTRTAQNNDSQLWMFEEVLNPVG